MPTNLNHHQSKNFK